MKILLTNYFSDQQRLLSRSESQVERAFEVFQECNDLQERCKKEMEILKAERKRLMVRMGEIDKDIDEVHNNNCVELGETLT